MIMNYWFPSLPLFPQVQEDSGIRILKSATIRSAFENGILHADIPMPADVHVYSISVNGCGIKPDSGHNSIGLNLSQRNLHHSNRFSCTQDFGMINAGL